MGKAFKPEMQVVRFGAEDVIATSGRSVTLSGWGDDTRANNMMEFGSYSHKPAIPSAWNGEQLRTDFNSYFDGTNASSEHISFGTYTLQELLWDGKNANYTKPGSDANGTYTYIGGGQFRKQ